MGGGGVARTMVVVSAGLPRQRSCCCWHGRAGHSRCDDEEGGGGRSVTRNIDTHSFDFGKFKFVIQFLKSCVPLNATTMLSPSPSSTVPTNACVDVFLSVKTWAFVQEKKKQGTQKDNSKSRPCTERATGANRDAKELVSCTACWRRLYLHDAVFLRS